MLEGCHIAEKELETLKASWKVTLKDSLKVYLMVLVATISGALDGS